MKGVKRTGAGDAHGRLPKVARVGKHETKFSMEDRVTLLEIIKSQLLLSRDTLPYKFTMAKFEWDKVRFGSYTADQCHQEFEYIQSNIKKIRSDHDVIGEAMSLVQSPSYIHKISLLKEGRAKKLLQSAWENLEMHKKTTRKEKFLRMHARLEQLLYDCPITPHTSGYGIFKSEKIKCEDVMYLERKEKMKAIAQKWKKASKVEKNKYEAKKNTLWKKYSKNNQKFKKTIESFFQSLSERDQQLLERVLRNPEGKKKGSKATQGVEKEDSSSEDESEEEEASSSEEESDDEEEYEDGAEENTEEAKKGAEETESDHEEQMQGVAKESQPSDEETSSSSGSSS